jgi:hypothetical protein
MSSGSSELVIVPVRCSTPQQQLALISGVSKERSLADIRSLGNFAGRRDCVAFFRKNIARRLLTTAAAP